MAYICIMANSKLQRLFFQLITTTLVLLIADYLMDSIGFDQGWVAIITAIVLAVLNAFLKPLLVLLTIPATLLTLGLFLLVINAAIILIAAEIVPGFHVASFWSAVWLSLLISIANGFILGNIRVERHNINNGNDFPM